MNGGSETAQSDATRPATESRTESAATSSPPHKPVSAAAQRALAEAAARRQAVERSSPAEVGGRGGLEPIRYGDWEVKGIASDF